MTTKQFEALVYLLAMYPNPATDAILADLKAEQEKGTASAPATPETKENT